jgi:hypothetical protein
MVNGRFHVDVNRRLFVSVDIDYSLGAPAAHIPCNITTTQK